MFYLDEKLENKNEMLELKASMLDTDLFSSNQLRNETRSLRFASAEHVSMYCLSHILSKACILCVKESRPDPFMTIKAHSKIEQSMYALSQRLSRQQRTTTKKNSKRRVMAELAVSIAASKAGLLGDMLTKKLTSSISGELKLLHRVAGEVQYIKKELEIMTAFLAWAEEVEQESNRVAREWAKQVRELAYEVEDCIDEFTLHLSRSRCTMRSLLSLRTRHQIAAKIQSLKSEIVDVSNRRLRYDLKAATPASSSSLGAQRDPRLGAMFVEDAQLVGLDGPRDEIVKWLLEEHDQLGVISVFGMGGLGKTTLVRKVYENPNLIGGHFHCGAWVTVSQSVNVELLLREMIKQLFRIVPEKMDEMNEGRLVEMLRNHLQKERYLIVFDDLWSIPAWESLKLALPENEFGSWIIVTTRNEAVANTCCTSHHHHHTYRLGFLSSEKSWELFCKRVFRGSNHYCPPELKDLSEEILKKCGGLPLAIVTTAGILASKPKKTGEEWRNLLSRLKLGSELDTNPSLEGMKQVLNLGYNDLPYNLKHCFLYLSIFPEDYLINSKCLRRMWMAEGFVGEHRGMTKEEVAESYFNELNNRSMILPSAISANGKVKNFRLHDIMLEVIISKSMEMNTVFLRELGHRSSWISGGVVVRRLSVYSDPNGSLKNILEGTSLSRVRTSAIFNDGGSSLSVFRLMRMLRVVHLEGCGYSDIPHDFTGLGKLRHLKYLSLRKTPMRVLPKSYRKLRNLEVLDVRDTMMFKVPKWIGELQQLRHIYGGGSIRKDLTYRSVVVPKGIRRLKSLQSLSGMAVGAAMAKGLGELSELRKLGVSGLTEYHRMDFCASLAKLSCLRSLRIEIDIFNHGISLDDHVSSSPPLLLQHLELLGHLAKLPRWVGSLNEMVKLTLLATRLGNDGIGLRLLQALPNLSHFELWRESYVGDRLCFGGGFGSLRVLVIDSLELKSLEFQGGAMINLQSLHIGDCDALEIILGCEELVNLKEVKVNLKSEQVDMVRRIVEAHPAQPRFFKYVIPRTR